MPRFLRASVPAGQTAQTLRLWKKIPRVAKTPRLPSKEVAENQHRQPATPTQPLQAERAGTFEDAKPGDRTPRVKNQRTTQPLQSADSRNELETTVSV